MSKCKSYFPQLTAECLAESPKNYTYRCTLAVMTIFMFLR